MGLPGIRRPSLFWCSIAFMNASYTLIVRPSAFSVGVFTPARGGHPAKRKGHQLQNRDNHRAPAHVSQNALA
jgi:hypothetical protein